MDVAWDTPLLEGYRYEFLPPLRLRGKTYNTKVSASSPISRGLYHRLRRTPDNRLNSGPAFDALWVHGYASVNPLQGILAANALGIPVLLRAESWTGDRSRTSRKRALKNLLFPLLRHAIAAVLPIGSLNAAYWSRYFGTEVPQFPMPYAVDNAYFAQLAESAAPLEAALREELQLRDGRPVILFASKLQARKHADHLVEAYARFIVHQPAATRPYLVIVGEGEERARLEERCRELHLDDTRFAGFRNQSELPRFFRLADVFVLPSRHEPWGLVVNEAMAAGCPVIVSTDVGCHADLVTDGVEGCVFPAGDIEALTAALYRVFRTADTARTMGQAARRRVASWSFEDDVRGLRQALAYTTHRIRA